MINIEDRIQIKNQISSLTTIDELAKFLNTSKKQLIYYSLILPEDKKYKKFSILKKSGTFREISAPSKTLKYIQKQLADKLQILYEPSNTAHGFIKQYQNKENQTITPSIISNAQVHIRKKYILNIDLKDFFPTISKKRVYGLFKNQYSISSKIAHYLTFLCCTENGLPQGAPTSPIITNMICSRLDRKLKSLSSKNYVTYSRYADDLSFSTSKNHFQNDFETNINKIIQNEGFVLNEKKRRLLIKENRLEVTGLTVNVKTNVQRKYVRSLRAIFNNIEKKGIQASVRDYRNFKNITSEVNADSMKKYIKGKLEYLGQVKGKDDPVFIKFNNKFSDIFEPEKKINKELKIESAEFIDKRNELLLKFNSDIVNSLSEVNEELKNIKTRIKQKLDKARKILLSPDKNNYLETVCLLWYSCLNEFQKIHFKDEKDSNNKFTGNSILDNRTIDKNEYSKNALKIPDDKNISYLSKRIPRFENQKIKDVNKLSVLIQIYLYENNLEKAVFEFIWLNEIRNRLNLTHSDDNNIKKCNYSERVSWTECSWFYRFIYFVFKHINIPTNNIFTDNPYLNKNLLGNNMYISGRVKYIIKEKVKTELIIIFNNNDLVEEHTINCQIWANSIVEDFNEKERIKNLNNSFINQNISEGDFVKVNVDFNAKLNEKTGKYHNNISIKSIEKQPKPNFFT